MEGDRMRLLSIVPIVLALNANLALPQNQHYFADFVGNASGPVYATTDRYEGSAGGMYWIDQNCQGQSMLFFRKGLGVFPGGPGGSEDHFLESGFWKQISEITYSQANWGQMLPDHRVFRDDATMRKGYIRFPEAIPQSGSYRVIPSFWEERWDLTCYATTHTTFAGSVFSASDAVYDESFGMSVTDCRSPVRKAGKCGTTPIPVSFWQHVEFWWGGGGGQHRNLQVWTMA